MDFALSPEIDELRLRIRAYVDERIIPLEADPASYDEHENITKPLLETLRAEVKAKGLWALNMPQERGGGGQNGDGGQKGGETECLQTDHDQSLGQALALCAFLSTESAMEAGSARGVSNRPSSGITTRKKAK